MKKLLFLLAVSATLLTMSCEESTPDKTPENIFAGKAWEYKSYNGEILRYYIKISFTNNGFSLYEKTDTTGIESPERIYENSTNGTYSLFYEEKPNPPFEPLLDERIVFTSDNVRLNGIAGYTTTYHYGIGNPAPDGHIVFYNISGDCSLITISINGTLGYLFLPVN